MKPDFELCDHGSVCVLVPRTADAREWIEDHVDPAAMRWAGGVAIEPRYVADIIEGFQAEGLTL
jgi:hypothetical protein